MCLRPIIVFFPIVIHNCHVCSISYHLRCWTLTFVQQESKHAWSCLGKTSHPKEHIQHLCGKLLLFIDHIKRHQASSLNFWETGAAECAWWSFHTARWYTTAFESSSAHLWLSNHKGCLGFGEILGLSKSYTNHAYHVNTTHGISFLWDRRWVPKADLFPRGCT